MATPRKENPQPAGRPTDYRPEYCQLVVEHMSQGASLTSFAAEVGVSRATINVWMQAHPEFLEAANAGKAKCAQWWERVARNNAESGQGNATLTVFGLKNMGAEDWADKQQVDHTSSDGSMTPKGLDASKLSTEALAEIMAAADAAKRS